MRRADDDIFKIYEDNSSFVGSTTLRTRNSFQSVELINAQSWWRWESSTIRGYAGSARVFGIKIGHICFSLDVDLLGVAGAKVIYL